MPHGSPTRGRLERRLAALMLEVRSYPTPIARCDLHLQALVAERTAVLDELRRLDATSRGCSPEANWINDGGFNAA